MELPQYSHNMEVHTVRIIGLKQEGGEFIGAERQNECSYFTFIKAAIELHLMSTHS